MELILRFFAFMVAIGLVRFAFRHLGTPGKVLAIFTAAGFVYIALS